MKYKTLFILVLTFLSQSISAYSKRLETTLVKDSVLKDTSNYIPLLELNKRWLSKFLKNQFEPPTFRYSVVDTERVYDKLYFIIKRDYKDATYNYQFSSNSYFREDPFERKIYIMYDVDSVKEKLFYDFSLAVGDTFYYYRDTIILKSISPFALENSVSKLFEFINTKGDTVKWVEGIGSLNRFGNNVGGSYQSSEELICVKNKKKEMVFLKPNYEGLCEDELSLGISAKTGSKILVYPNPVSNIINLSLDIGLIKEIKILDVFGIVLFHFKNISTIEFQINNLSELNTGMYLLQINTTHDIQWKKIVKN